MSNEIPIQNLINAYGDWIKHQEQYDGRIPYYVNIMFNPLKGSRQAIINQMTHTIEYSLFANLCKHLDRHPRRRGRRQFLPQTIFSLDLPTFKNNKKLQCREVTLNGGLHVNGIITIPPRSRLKEGLPGHFQRLRQLHLRHGIMRVHAEAITCTPRRVVDYSMKTFKAGRIDYDTLIILPRSLSELQTRNRCLDPIRRAIQDIQSATNVSDELALQRLRSCCP